MRNGKAKAADQRRKKETKMKSFIAAYQINAAKRALYRRTRNEFAAMPRHVALDLGIVPEDADQIARAAVWG